MCGNTDNSNAGNYQLRAQTWSFGDEKEGVTVSNCCISERLVGGGSELTALIFHQNINLNFDT
jgi:hypothetical protein